MSRDLQNIFSRTKKNTSRNFEIWVEKNGQRSLFLDSNSFFNSTRALFFDSNFNFFFRSWTYILQISTHIFYCIRFILQVSTYVLCFQHVFTIGIILSATERHSWHSHEFKMVDDGLRCKNFISHECFAHGLDN